MSAKTIVIACDTFSPDHNGTATFSKHLACVLSERGYEVHVIAPATSRLYGTFREQHDGVPLIIHRLKSHRIPFQPTLRFVSPLWLTSKIQGLFGAIKPEVVHIQSHINIGHHAAVAAKKLELRLIATSHIDLESVIENTIIAPRFVKSFLTNLLLRDAARVFKSADAIAAPTRRSAQMLESVVKGLRVYPISGGVETSLYKDLPEPEQDSRKLVYVGRLDLEKHVYVALEAMAKLPEGFDVSLEVIGSGAQAEELEQLAKELGISERINFLGEVSDAEVIEALGSASAFVMPSVQELQSMATLEAMAAGRPIIAANAMALPHLVIDGVNGFLFKPDSPADLAAKIVKLFELPKNSFKKLSAGSRVLVQSHDLEDTVTVYERLYNGLEVNETTLDNDPNYEAAISPTTRLAEFVRSGSRSIERRASGVLERLTGVRGSVTETFSDVRFMIERRGKKVRKKLSSALRRALESIRRDD